MCKACTRIPEHFIAGHRVFVRPVVRKEVYKVCNFKSKICTNSFCIAEYPSSRLKRKKIFLLFLLWCFSFLSSALRVLCCDSSSIVPTFRALRSIFLQRAEQAERERIAREEKLKADEEERLYSLVTCTPGFAYYGPSFRANQKPSPFPPVQSCLVPPPPPPYPPPRPEPYVPPPAISTTYSSGVSTHPLSSHSWVPLLPATTSSSQQVSDASNTASIMAGYGGRQNSGFF